MSAARLALLIVIFFAFAEPLFAHYHILLPDRSSAKTDEAVTFTLQFGHPFEHQMFDTQRPTELYVIAPDGSKTDLISKLMQFKMEGVDGKKVTGYKFEFVPTKRGDYTFVAVCPEQNVEGEPLPLRDIAKVVLHVQTQNGWDCRAVASKSGALELSPLTRPYGLTAGMAIHVEADELTPTDRKPLGHAEIEVERYNPIAPKELPPEEQITRSCRTSRAGDAVLTLTEAGWWGVTALHAQGKVQHRCTYWVYVDPAVK